MDFVDINKAFEESPEVYSKLTKNADKIMALYDNLKDLVENDFRNCWTDDYDYNSIKEMIENKKYMFEDMRDIIYEYSEKYLAYIEDKKNLCPCLCCQKYFSNKRNVKISYK